MLLVLHRVLSLPVLSTVSALQYVGIIQLKEEPVKMEAHHARYSSLGLAVHTFVFLAKYISCHFECVLGFLHAQGC